jgi:hypothetical protein
MPARIAHKVAVLNRSTVLSDSEVHAISSALQKAVSRDFAGVWGIDASMSFVQRGAKTGWQGRWNLLVLDDSDTANALGYHDVTPEGLPLGKVFAGTDAKYGAKVSVTFAHELFEMLLDPWISLCAEDSRRGVFVAYEASDAVEADELAYDVDGVPVSDFVTPAFFDPTARGRAGERFSFCEHVHAPFELAPGGYESVYVPGRGWTQRTARMAQDGELSSDRPRVGSRRERRAAGVDRWQASPA